MFTVPGDQLFSGPAFAAGRAWAPASASDDLADVLMSRYENGSTVITSNRVIDDWPKLLGDVVVVTPLLDRLMHHGHLLKFEGKSWRLKEAAARVAKAAVAA